MRRVEAVLGVICAIVWALVVLRSPLLDVDRVQIVGAERTGATAIERAGGVTRGMPLVEVDLDGTRRGVAALPWIDEVRTARLWPGTIRIVVSERTEVAAVGHDEGWALLDADGRVLAVVDDEPDLPALTGERRAAPGATLDRDDRAVLAVLGALPTSLRQAVDRADQGGDGVELVLDDGFRVILGDAGQLTAKAQAAEAVRRHAAPAGAACRIDVRVPTAPVLTSGRGCA